MVDENRSILAPPDTSCWAFRGFQSSIPTALCKVVLSRASTTVGNENCNRPLSRTSSRALKKNLTPNRNGIHFRWDSSFISAHVRTVDYSLWYRPSVSRALDVRIDREPVDGAEYSWTFVGTPSRINLLSFASLAAGRFAYPVVTSERSSLRRFADSTPADSSGLTLTRKWRGNFIDESLAPRLVITLHAIKINK